MLRTNRNKKFSLLTLAAGLIVTVSITPPATAQEHQNGTCTIRQKTQDESAYRFPISRAQYEPTTYTQDRFPEFRSLQDTPLPSSSRHPSFDSRELDSNYLARDTYGTSQDSGRSREWLQYHEQLDRRQSDLDYPARRTRDQYAPARERNDYRYSGFDYEGDSRRRPVEERLRSPYGDSDIGRIRVRGRYDDDGTMPMRDHLQRRPASDGFPPRRQYPGSQGSNYGPTDRGTGSNFRNDRFQDRYQPAREDVRKEPTLDQKVTARYSNPQVIQFASTLTAGQGLTLFREVSTLIDQRHLSPKPYTERLSNGVRNLEVALQNRAFRNAVPMQASTAQLNGLGSRLAQLTNRPINSVREAEQVVSSAMQMAAQAGIRPGLVAYEFANGSVQSLDKYSGLDPSSNRVSGALEDGVQTAMGALDEQVTGVGIEVRHHAAGLEIVRALRGGPAVEAGIQSGDIIRQINGRDIAGMEMNSTVSMISGSAGSPIRFLVGREGRGTRTFSLVRRTFRIYSVNDVKMVDRETGVGYMHLNKFAQSSAAEMEQAIQELRSQGMKNLIVDVRGNPGGLLTTAIEVSDKFLRCGKIVATRGRLGSDNSVETANAGGTWSMPLVVLVDGDSASASEIFAAAIQENGRGLVVGEKSYGKGTVQTHFPLGSGLGTVRLTTAKFYSPTDREMSGAGVTPDVLTNDKNDAMDRAVAAASHPRVAEMVAEHGTCRPPSTRPRSYGSAARPVDNLSVVFGN